METKILYFICEGVTELTLIKKLLEKNNFIENNFKSFDSNNEDLKKLENWILDRIS